MTLSANRDNDSNGRATVKVTTTYGPITNTVTEDAGHVRSFHTQLGQVLDAIDAEQKASAE